jgi:hypothetical protein
MGRSFPWLAAKKRYGVAKKPEGIFSCMVAWNTLTLLDVTHEVNPGGDFRTPDGGGSESAGPSQRLQAHCGQPELLNFA